MGESRNTKMPFQTKHRRRIADPMTFFRRAVNKFNSLWLRYTYPFYSVGKKLSVHCGAQLEREIADRIKIGNFVILYEHSWLNVSASDNGGDPVITLEDGCVIGRRATISAKNSVHLDRDVLISQSVLIMDHSHEYEDINLPIKAQGVSEGGHIRIGRGCWIGHGAAIVCTKGDLTLGENCIVGANALVTRSFPAFSVVSGNPARVVKQFDFSRNAWVLGSSRPVEAEVTTRDAPVQVR